MKEKEKTLAMIQLATATQLTKKSPIIHQRYHTIIAACQKYHWVETDINKILDWAESFVEESTQEKDATNAISLYYRIRYKQSTDTTDGCLMDAIYTVWKENHGTWNNTYVHQILQRLKEETDE